MVSIWNAQREMVLYAINALNKHNIFRSSDESQFNLSSAKYTKKYDFINIRRKN